MENLSGCSPQRHRSCLRPGRTAVLMQKQVIDSIGDGCRCKGTSRKPLNLAALALSTMAEDGNLKFITPPTSVGSTSDSGKAPHRACLTSYDQFPCRRWNPIPGSRRSLWFLWRKAGRNRQYDSSPLVSHEIQTVSGCSNAAVAGAELIVILWALPTAFTAKLDSGQCGLGGVG